MFALLDLSAVFSLLQVKHMHDTGSRDEELERDISYLANNFSTHRLSIFLPELQSPRGGRRRDAGDRDPRNQARSADYERFGDHHRRPTILRNARPGAQQTAEPADQVNSFRSNTNAGK
jgi:hypothetical protein